MKLYPLIAVLSFALFVTSCKRKPTCSDGKLNQNETRTDCGGPCADCETCSDGIKNQDESETDCGGVCSKCGTCTDAIKNQGESGIDCGGPCVKCPSCDDGIKNQNEVEVDCGGVCKKCPITYPIAGKHGNSILHTDPTTIKSGQNTTSYTMRATVPAETKLKVVMKNTTVGSNSLWYYYNATVEGWDITTYDSNTQSQIFYANGTGNCDLQMYFTGSGSATIEFYENESSTPTRTKLITWQP